MCAPGLQTVGRRARTLLVNVNLERDHGPTAAARSLVRGRMSARQAPSARGSPRRDHTTGLSAEIVTARHCGRSVAAVRFLTWSSNDFTRSRRADKACLLEEIAWNIAALQECDLAPSDLLCDSADVDALQFVPSSVKANHNGCALLSRGGSIDDARTWPSAAYDHDHREQPLPVRCLGRP